MHIHGLRATALIAGASTMVCAAAILPANATTQAPVSIGANHIMDDEPPVLVGASDIAGCYALEGAEATADLLEDIPGTIFTAGDNSQDSGTLDQYTYCFGSTWGRFKDRIRPAPGNHDLSGYGASSGYYKYFGAAAGEAGKGYYSYDLGEWHIVALNSNCLRVGGCGPGSPQESWLREDLEASTKPCTAAYWHHPLFTSGTFEPSSPEVRPLFQALYDYGAEIVMNGHNHIYERFAPQTPAGEVDPKYGIRVFEVGTGGYSHYPMSFFPADNSEARDNETFGVLKLTLWGDAYDWEFIPEADGSFTDSGSTSCHDAPQEPEPSPSNSSPGWPWPTWPPRPTWPDTAR